MKGQEILEMVSISLYLIVSLLSANTLVDVFDLNAVRPVFMILFTSCIFLGLLKLKLVLIKSK